MNPNSNFHMYQGMDDMLSLSHGVDSYSSTLIYNLSVLRGKIHHLESFVTAIISSEQIQRQPDTVAISNAEAVLQEIISTASLTARALQQINLDFCPPNDIITSGLFTIDHQFNGNPSNNLSNPRNNGENEASSSRTLNEDHNQATIIATQLSMNSEAVSIQNNECNPNIVELDAEALLARYAHYCQVCGKGFKRDANLRMHMRAHGDEYKTKSALTNPTKSSQLMKETGSSPKYSCPQEGCRWNKKHPRFTPLKSMACVKNHYKRSHCAKMYVCKRCNQKQFSVLSDLSTHEKHCGELRWRCSCGTFFSRKDKLMGHVALFVGHEPV